MQILPYNTRYSLATDYGLRTTGYGLRTMSVLVEEDGIRFRYPENWSLERQENESGWTVSVQSPGTAFLLLSYDESMPETEEVAGAALEALREDYPDLDADACVDSVAGQPA